MKRLNSGFTLIELMIVVAIIGILAAVAIPQYQNYVARAQVSEAFSLMSGAKTAVAEYFITNGTFPADNPAAGLPVNPADISGKFVAAVNVLRTPEGRGVITATFSNDTHPKLRGGEVALYANDTGGSINFTCMGEGAYGVDIDPYLPSFCYKESAGF